MAEKALTIDATTKLVSQVNDGDVLMVGTGIQSNTNGISIRPAANATNGIIFANATGTGVAAVDTSNGRLYVGNSTTPPTARIHVAAGAAAVGSAPIKLTSGTLLGSAEDGALEYDGSFWWITVGSLRSKIIANPYGLTGYTTAWTGNAATSYNTALGEATAAYAASGGERTIIGYSSGAALNGGVRNTFLGAYSGY